MSVGVSLGLPTALRDWEEALINHHLKIGDGGDATPARSLEITADTLAALFPVTAPSAAEAEAAFQRATRSDPYLFGALREGRRRNATTSSPNCFAYLCMSLLIDTLLDGAYSEQGQLRDRLRTWLGTSRSMTQLSGLATMWRELAAWLDARADSGEGYRRLVLPAPPRTWTQIGYTRRLSFPTRSDIRFLERVLASFPRGVADPPGLMRAIEAAVERGASWGMEAAFAEFRDAFRNGGASSDHRFWKLVLRAAGRVSNAPVRNETVLEMEYDEDGRRTMRVEKSVPVADLGSAMRSSGVLASANLAAAAARGVVFFRQVGMARWHCEAEPPLGLAHVGVSPAHAARVRGMVLELEASGDWLITISPVRPGTVDELLSRLHLARLRTERLIDITLEGGVRTGGGFLGCSRFLPHVDAGDRQVTARALPGQQLAPAVLAPHGALQSETTVDGHYELSVASGREGDAPEWTRRVRFHRDAVPHAEVGGMANREPEVVEWLSMGSSAIPRPIGEDVEWHGQTDAPADLLEAIYAATRAGAPEADMFELVARGIDDGTDPWTVLRSIQEAHFAVARTRSTWRGRVWTIDPPRLLRHSGGAVVTGAVCKALYHEFREVSSAIGGTPFRRKGASRWTPPLLGAIGVDVDLLATRLGWMIADPRSVPILQPGGLETSPIMAAHHVLASRWDWQWRRFVTSGTGPCEVSLTRWIHPGGRDHDQYRVQSATHVSCHSTRNAAILMAHMVAGVPLFSIKKGSLVRTAREGALPLEIAQWLRGRALAGGGPRPEGTYVYPLGDVQPTDLARALPRCIEGIPVATRHDAVAGPAEISAARRSGGRIRLCWVDGAVTATR